MQNSLSKQFGDRDVFVLLFSVLQNDSVLQKDISIFSRSVPFFFAHPHAKDVNSVVISTNAKTHSFMKPPLRRCFPESFLSFLMSPLSLTFIMPLLGALTKQSPQNEQLSLEEMKRMLRTARERFSLDPPPMVQVHDVCSSNSSAIFP